ncbi:MAG TPA: MoxR family ATPase [Pirellulaceae bacterium]|nr:MoxR family ATPase [Pirellulaceae bacterium]HMO92362.1 MoxR family ATPase [Pirellulaceae bacterium]HMP71310.1 MoxR family ATPase [Pirellulaceae bacterium]
MSETAILTGTSRTQINHGIAQLRTVLNRALMGKAEVIEYVMAGLLAGGHILFDDLPGLGKTTLGKAVAAAVGGKFGRIQGTPDLLPSDVTGFNLFNRKTQEFEFRPGPVFSDVLLADEINRATPRTQSALFEAMGERQVSVDGKTFPLLETFFVIATQNPIDHSGTFELPEAQLDRFAMKLTIGYPSADDEIALLKDEAVRDSANPKRPEQVITPNELRRWQDEVARVEVAEKVQRYLVAIATAIRGHKEIRNGLSPRGLIMLQRLSQAFAMLQERDFVTPDDIQQVAKPVLRVRLSGNFDSADPIIQEILNSVPVPV